MILAGHGRVAAALHLGLASIPCVRIDHMSAEQKRAYILADNKLAQNAGWDEEILATELQFLLQAEIDFEVGITGFETHEIDGLIEGLAPEEPDDPADDVLPDVPKNGATVSLCGSRVGRADKLGFIPRANPHAFAAVMPLDNPGGEDRVSSMD